MNKKFLRSKGVFFFLVLIMSGCKGKEAIKTLKIVPNDKTGQDAIISRAYHANNYGHLEYLHLWSRIKADTIKDDNRFALSFEINGIDKSAEIDSSFIYLVKPNQVMIKEVYMYNELPILG